MPRRRTVNRNLPPNMQRKGHAYYFVKMVDGHNRWIALGSDLPAARVKWAELMNEGVPVAESTTFAEAALRYLREVVPLKAPKTQEEYTRQLHALLPVFGALPLDLITPQFVRQYLDSRSAKVAGNREKALLSTVFNHAREWGLTNAANPCAGVRGHRELGRSRYIEDKELLAVLDHGCQPLRDAIELAYYTGQRPSDVLKLKRTDIREGTLFIRQRKTSTALRVQIDGPLFDVLARISANMALQAGAVKSLYLVQTEDGQPLSYRSLHWRFSKAREKAGVPDFQFRDIRAKAATDTEEIGGIGHAQRLLGHKTRTMTEHYVKDRIGYRVAPTPKRLVAPKHKKSS